MSIGLCCQYIEKIESPRGKISYKNLFEEKVLQYNKFLKNEYAEEKIVDTWINNISKVRNLLPKIYNEGISVFRLSSGYFPLHDSLNEKLINNQQIKEILKDIGNFALSNGIRLTCHPDQFVVLNSKNPQVIENSKRMLKHHAWIMDCMNLPLTPYYAINIHGGVSGEKSSLVKETNSLDQNIKKRLTFENDERGWSVAELYDIWKETEVPIVIDTHHHTFNNGNLSIDEALELSGSTWGDIKPLTHLSNTEPGSENGSFTERRKHSNYAHYIPELQKRLNNQNKIDIDFEFKMKQLAIFKAASDLEIKI